MRGFEKYEIYYATPSFHMHLLLQQSAIRYLIFFFVRFCEKSFSHGIFFSNSMNLRQIILMTRLTFTRLSSSLLLLLLLLLVL